MSCVMSYIVSDVVKKGREGAMLLHPTLPYPTLPYIHHSIIVLIFNEILNIHHDIE